MVAFIYTPLKKPTAEIRLFELFPGRGRLQGWLNHHELEAVQGKYVALSYCWGEERQSASVTVNQCTLSISKNLCAALKSIRQRHQGRLTIWIDALCINQTDTEEKSAQVSIMRDIYFLGTQTYVWLGPHDLWTALAFKEMRLRAAWERKHGTGQTNVGWWEWRRLHSGFNVEVDEQSDGGDGLLTRLMARVPFLGTPAKLSIFRRPWFSRCWIVQEIATSRVITMICGKYHIDWEDMEAACQVFSEMAYDELRTLVYIRQRFRNAETSRLENLLWRTNTFQAKDPRDRIFSLLGLVSDDAAIGPDGSPDQSDTRSDIHVDYNASTRDIYIHVTLQHLRTTGHAGILAAALGQRTIEAGDFPSWVLNPEPSRADPQGTHSFAWAGTQTDYGSGTGGWAAAGLSRCNPELDIENGFLGLQGIIVDVVEFVGLEREGITIRQKELGLRAMIGHVITGAGNIKCYFQWRALSGVGIDEFYRDTSMTAEQAFLEIMSPRMPTARRDDLLTDESHWHMARQFDRFVTSTFPYMERRIIGKLRVTELVRIIITSMKVLSQANRGKRHDVAAAADFEAKDTLSTSRRFVRTSRGYIGLGGPHVAVGDSIALLAGSPAPFLLRRTDSGRYKVVSDAYFVQMMVGELWGPNIIDTIWLE
ncbi:heterokaryon incompatibility protein-domain-containing protein [Xylariales sp. PMI_506]|nr:heterokaryon incompatibility protein-domain-containing protein [Xylariales sp. PMI_506]